MVETLRKSTYTFKCSVFPSFEIKSVRNAPCIPSDFAKENKNGTKRIVFIWMDTKQGFLVLNYPKDNKFVRRLKNDQGITIDCWKVVKWIFTWNWSAQWKNLDRRSNDNLYLFCKRIDFICDNQLAEDIWTPWYQ